MRRCTNLGLFWRLPSCGPGFESQAHHLRFFNFILLSYCISVCCCWKEKRTKINKKIPGLTHFLQKTWDYLIRLLVPGYLKVSWNRVRGTEYVEDLLKRFPLKVATTKNNKQYFTDNSVRARVKEREREREREGERRDPLKICIKTFTTTYLPTSHKHAIGR